jgi:lipoate-protein ligase A
MSAVLGRLLLWRDPEARPGPENMAIDEVLLEHLGSDPLLRIYDWAGDWASLGYFQDLAEARRLFTGQGMHFVRRMTGGGIVDHRRDLTYSLLVPRGSDLAEGRGDESYRVIHAAVAEALRRSGLAARVLTEDGPGDSAACFEKGVAWDVAGEDGAKLAGAGQKRSRDGLLHQGSVLAPEARGELGWRLPRTLAREAVEWSPDAGLLARARVLATEKYATAAWLERR